MTPKTVGANLAAVLNSFTAVAGRPSYDDIKAMRDALTAILVAIPYDTANNSTHNLWGLIAPVATYQTKYTKNFSRPTAPDTYPTLADDAKNVVRAREEAKHQAQQAGFALFDASECSCQKFVLDIVDEMWYHEPKNEHSGYALLTTHAIFTHLSKQ